MGSLGTRYAWIGLTTPRHTTTAGFVVTGNTVGRCLCAQIGLVQAFDVKQMTTRQSNHEVFFDIVIGFEGVQCINGDA